ncbi:energy transducer TonB [Rhizosaccharibacter radicis]|uniref:Energy transducer TonB n=1 Tax=Rhizosaccharibacter radicis TaxID=2782605 RepID=A0ABT1W1Q4_9PROT|nr:energy transducer TonB [Acetobacteraceae bacterium KSS12]
MIVAIVAMAIPAAARLAAANAPFDAGHPMQDVHLVPVHRQPPVLAPALRQLGLEGEVNVECAITTKGIPNGCHVMSSTDRRLDDAALQAARGDRFQPLIQNGRAQPVTWYHDRYVFQTRHDLPPALPGEHVRLPPAPPLAAVATADPAATDDKPMVGLFPDYPAELRNRKIQGWVLMDCAITEAGTTEHCQAVHSSDPRFEPSAYDFVRRARYRPITVDGHPARQEHRMLQISYRLDRHPSASASSASP